MAIKPMLYPSTRDVTVEFYLREKKGHFEVRMLGFCITHGYLCLILTQDQL